MSDQPVPAFTQPLRAQVEYFSLDEPSERQFMAIYGPNDELVAVVASIAETVSANRAAGAEHCALPAQANTQLFLQAPQCHAACVAALAAFDTGVRDASRVLFARLFAEIRDMSPPAGAAPPFTQPLSAAPAPATFYVVEPPPEEGPDHLVLGPRGEIVAMVQVWDPGIGVPGQPKPPPVLLPAAANAALFAAAPELYAAAVAAKTALLGAPFQDQVARKTVTALLRTALAKATVTHDAAKADAT